MCFKERHIFFLNLTHYDIALSIVFIIFVHTYESNIAEEIASSKKRPESTIIGY